MNEILILGGAVVVVAFIILMANSLNAEKRKVAEEEEKERKRKEREDWTLNYFEMLSKGFDSDELEKIKNGEEWIGMSSYALIAMYGKPNDRQEKILKTKKKELLIYTEKNKSTKRKVNNTFTFENDELVSIDKKTPLIKVWDKWQQVAPFSLKD